MLPASEYHNNAAVGGRFAVLHTTAIVLFEQGLAGGNDEHHTGSDVVLHHHSRIVARQLFL